MELLAEDHRTTWTADIEFGRTRRRAGLSTTVPGRRTVEREGYISLGGL